MRPYVISIHILVYFSYLIHWCWQSVTADETPAAHHIVHYEEIGVILRSMAKYEPVSNFVGVLFVHDGTCSHNEDAQQALGGAFALLGDYLEKESEVLQGFRQPALFNLLVGEGKDVGIEVLVFPSAYIIYNSEDRVTVQLLEFDLLESENDLFESLMLYFYRLVVIPGRIDHSEASLDIHPPPFKSVDDAVEFIGRHHTFFQLGEMKEIVVPPSVNFDKDMDGIVQWLFDEGNALEAPFWLILQCRSAPRTSLFDEFDRLSQELIRLQSVFFGTLDKCDFGNGNVQMARLYRNGTLEHCSTVLPSTSTGLADEVLMYTSPSALWYDKPSTFPILFPEFRKVHAVLFVDLFDIPEEFQDSEKARRIKRVIHDFLLACHGHKYRSAQGPCVDCDIACMIVPSSEMRIWNTFGADVWTPVDRGEASVEEEFPSLLLTYQTDSGIKKYPLSAHECSLEGISTFFSAFCDGKLQPLQPEPSGPEQHTSSNSLVQFVEAKDLEQELTEAEAVPCIVFFTVFTCGHCKRFATLFNQLAKLLSELKWSERLLLYQVDVTRSDVTLTNVTVMWVPDLYFVSPDRTEVLQYSETDELEDGVGRLKDPMEILAWIISLISSDLASELLQSIREQRTA